MARFWPSWASTLLPAVLAWRTKDSNPWLPILLSAPAPETRNTLQNPNTVAPHPFSVPPWPAAPNAVWQTTLPPHSLAVFTLHRTR